MAGGVKRTYYLCLLCLSGCILTVAWAVQAIGGIPFMGVPCFLILQANVSFRTSLGSIRATTFRIRRILVGQLIRYPSNIVETID